MALVSFAEDGSSPDKWTLNQWTTWRDEEIKAIFAPLPAGEKISQREAVIIRSVDIYKFVAPTLAAKSKDPQWTKQMGHFVRFVTEQASMDPFDREGKYGHRLGYTVSDREYWDQSAAELQMPPFLRDPQFLKDMGNTGEFSFEQKKDLAQSYTVQGLMPPKKDLTADERAALWNSLRKQYLDPAGPSGLLVYWLKGG